MSSSGETEIFLNLARELGVHSVHLGKTMKLRQGQLWRQGDEFIRIVRLERLQVDYKTMLQPTSREGATHRATKKEFCRLLKGAQLLNDTLTAGGLKPPVPVDSKPV